jgi:hypothetical protein
VLDVQSRNQQNVVDLVQEGFRRRARPSQATTILRERSDDLTREDLLREVERLRLRVEQHENALTRLTEAMLRLRRGAQALREENHELRAELEMERRLRAADTASRST